MKKSGKTFRKIFGTTALTLCRKSTVPVLVIPEECSFGGITSIALAADLQMENDTGFDKTFIGFAERFHPEVNIVNVVNRNTTSDGRETNNAFDLNWRLKQISPGFAFIEDENVGHALEKFVAEKKVNLLAMYSYPHSLLEKLFVKSNIREMMFEGSVPLLVLPGKINHLRKEVVPGNQANDV